MTHPDYSANRPPYSPDQPPPGAFYGSGEPSKPRRKRRWADLGAVAQLALGIPWTLLSLAVVGMIGTALPPDPNVGFYLAVLIFLLSGGLVFFSPTEGILARVLFRFRQPTMGERQHLEAIWGNVAQAAGINPLKYRLWIDDTQDLNASAAAGHTVSVTTGALLNLPPNQLAAVLAHELGHHLRGHSWAGLLTYWYSLPGRLLVLIFKWITFGGLILARVIAAVFDRTGLISCLLLIPIYGFSICWLGYIAFALYSIHPALLLLFVSPLVGAWFSRYSEKRADRVAADLGFGPQLIEVFQAWMYQGMDIARKQAGVRANLLASHPSLASRIRALEKYLYGGKATA